MKKIYIYGASGHGLVVADIAKACGYDTIKFIDDGKNEYPTFEEIKDNIDAPIALGIGQNKIRKMIFDRLEKYELEIITLIHPSAIISESAKVGAGSVVMPLVVVNAKAIIGKGVILNTASVVEHESSIGDFVHISPNVSCAGNVKIAESTHIGIGSCIIQGIDIGNDAIIGAGSTVISDIGDNVLAYGNPCKIKKEINHE